jgi:hypothetical protein
LRSWTVWVVAASPLLGVASAALGGRLTWPRALGAAVGAGIVTTGGALAGGLLIAGPRDTMTNMTGRPTALDYVWMLAWAAVYALVVGGAATGVLRAAGWHR